MTLFEMPSRDLFLQLRDELSLHHIHGDIISADVVQPFQLRIIQMELMNCYDEAESLAHPFFIFACSH